MFISFGVGDEPQEFSERCRSNSDSLMMTSMAT